MNTSPMSMTPERSESPAPGLPHGDPGDDRDRDLGSSYFRRTSLAIAAARRFTLYEQAAAAPSSPISPRAGVHFAEDPNVVHTTPASPVRESGPSAPSPVPASPRARSGPFGVSFNTSFFGRSIGGGMPARYTSPLEEGPEDEEALLGDDSSGAVARSQGSARAHHMNVAAGHEAPPSLAPPTSPSTHQSSRLPPLSHETGGVGQRPVPRPRRGSSVVQARYRWLSGGNSNTGDEPGVDVRSQRDQDAYGHLKGKTHITVVDYCGDSDIEDTNVRVDLPGDRIAEWLKSSAGQRPCVDGKPCGVRWIHVSGLNWEVIKALTLKYGLHPLAVEDTLRSGRSPRSKCDFYANHLYLQILVYHIHAPDRAALARVAEGIPEGVTCDDLEGSNRPDSNASAIGKQEESKWVPSWWSGQSKGAIRLPEGIDSVFEPSGGYRYDPTNVAKEHNRLVIEQLSASYMVPIRRGILSAFMLRDGTLISISAHDIHEALAPIYERLEDENSLLRRSNDVSMLCHALLDVSVDLSVEITQAFEAEILKVEAKVLVSADLDLVRYLHIIQAQILRFRRQLSSLLHACYILRDQDTQRALAAGSLHQSRSHRAASDLASLNGIRSQSESQSHASSPHSVPPPGAAAPPGQGLSAPTPVPTRVVAPSAAPDTSPSGVSAQRPHIEIVTANPHHNGQLPNHLNSRIRRGSGSRIPVPNVTPAPPLLPIPTGAAATTVPTIGWFSPTAKLYMNDVIDHLENIVSSAEQYVGTCDHLTDYCFNVLTFHTNNSMERLSIVTVLFLPLTFISSFYGMNFEDFPALNNSDKYFWKVAAPCTVVFFFIFSFSYITSAWDTFTRRMARIRQKQEVLAAKKRE